MTRQEYYPTRIGDQVVWLRNLKTKLPLHTGILELVPAEVTTLQLDLDNAIYALEAYRGALTAHREAAFQRIEDVLTNDTVPGDVVWLTFAAPTPVPAAVPYGVLRRVFEYIGEDIKKADAYDLAIGRDLGVEAPLMAAPDPTVSPDFDLRETGDHKLEVVWTKLIFDGVKLEFDLGSAGLKADMDLRPNYTLNWMPAVGTSAIIKVRLRYIYKGEDFGNWSPWEMWTLTGA